MADDDDVRGALGPEELFAPTGPRRSSFTPAPNDAESREAAANVFDDDEIAAALSAELARVASGPIPIQRPPAEAPAVVATPSVSESPAAPPEPASAPEPEPASVPEPETAEPPAPVAAPPTVPQGPPDWATPLFSEPAEPAQPVSDPFAPSAPSFVPSNGPFPPPGPSAPTPPTSPFFGVGDSADPAALVDPAQAPTPAQAADAEALRALYSAAPAPTVPPANAPPPPGYDSPTLATQSPVVDSPSTPGDLRPRRRALSGDGEGSGALSAIEQLQAQLDERDREAREYAAWESSMLEVGTPEALAAVDEARAERSGTVVAQPEPSTPTEESVAFLPPSASLGEDPIPFLPPPFDEPVADLAPPTEEPPFDLAPPPAEPAFDLAPPSAEPVFDLAPPMDQAAAAPPGMEEAIAAFPPPAPSEALPFPGFGTPSDEPPVDFSAPADPHELVFDPPPTLIEPPSPDGLADLWREASEDEALPGTPIPAAQQDLPVEAPAEQATVEPPADGPPAVESAPAPAAAPAGFEDLLVGFGNPDPQPPSTGWIAGDASPSPEPGEERRPFGEGVDRDEAVDPSDSIFGADPAPVSVNTAGVAVVPELAVVPPTPMTRLAPSDDELIVPVAPKISPPERAGLEPTPVEQRVGRSARLFWLWFAANSSIAAVVFGTIIFALGVSLRQAIVATLAGVALSFVPLGLGTLAGKRSGQPTMVISRATFGVVGNILPALLALLSRLFWAAALLWVLGAGTADILVGAKLTDGFTRDELTLVAIAIGFVVAVVIAYLGYAFIAIVQLVVSVISGVTILGFIALTWKYVNLTTALATPDGSWILAVTGAVLVFSFVGLAWANSSADVARYQRPGSSGAASMLWATFGVAIPSFLLIAYGALLASSNATLAANIAANPLDSLGRLLPIWYPVPLLAATGLSLLSGIVLAMYSGGFALQAAGLRLRRSLSTLLVGLLVVIISALLASSITDFTQLFRDFSTTVAVPIAAWAGLFGAEIMIRKRRFDSTSLLRRGGVYEDVRWVNLVSLVVITAVGFGFLSATLPALAWEGYLFTALGVPLTGQLATTDLGVLVALLLGLLVPLVAGHGGISRQEKATRVAE